jgi:hypothetical protein
MWYCEMIQCGDISSEREDKPVSECSAYYGNSNTTIYIYKRSCSDGEGIANHLVAAVKQPQSLQHHRPSRNQDCDVAVTVI